MYFNIIIIIISIVLYVLIVSSKRLDSQKKNIFFLVLFFLIIGFLTASRTYGTGTDTEMYMREFISISRTKWNSKIIGGYYEPLYVVFNILLSYLSNNPRILIVTSSIFITFSFYKFIKDNSKNYLLSVIMFIGLLIFYGTMNTIRQYIAISIILLGFDFVKNKKLLPYLLVVLTAYMFHSSALVGLIIYPLYHLKYSPFRVFLIFMVAFISNIFVSDLINYIYGIIGRVNYYSSRVGQENIANLIYMFLYFVMYLFSIFEMKKSKLKNEHNNFYLYIFIMSSAFSLVAMNMNVLSRATLYFNIFSIICLPNVISENIYDRRNKMAVNLIVIMMFTVYSSIIIHYRPEWNTAFDYKSCVIPNYQDVCNIN